jgi:hypothetical protein
MQKHGGLLVWATQSCWLCRTPSEKRIRVSSPPVSATSQNVEEHGTMFILDLDFQGSNQERNLGYRSTLGLLPDHPTLGGISVYRL